MPNLGPTELIIILVIIIVIFGAGKLAGLGSALGDGVRDFRAAMKEGEDEDEPGEQEASASEQEASAAEADVSDQVVKDEPRAEQAGEDV